MAGRVRVVPEGPGRFGKGVFDLQTWRGDFLRRFRFAERFDGRGKSQPQCPERQIDMVAGHVTDGTVAKVPEAPPLTAEILRVIRSFFRRAEPKVPIDVGRYFRRIC